jgi:hypothetical protein
VRRTADVLMIDATAVIVAVADIDTAAAEGTRERRETTRDRRPSRPMCRISPFSPGRLRRAELGVLWRGAVSCSGLDRYGTGGGSRRARAVGTSAVRCWPRPSARAGRLERCQHQGPGQGERHRARAGLRAITRGPDLSAVRRTAGQVVCSHGGVAVLAESFWSCRADRFQSAPGRLRLGPSWSFGRGTRTGDRRMAGGLVQLPGVSVASVSARSMCADAVPRWVAAEQPYTDGRATAAK